MKTVRDIFHPSIEYLEKHQVNEPKKSVEMLLSHVLKTSKLNLYCDFDRPLSQEELTTFKHFLQQRKTSKPIAYIEGTVAFLDCTLKVSEDCLIPRQETEQLAQMMIEHIGNKPGVLFDICTGSGCLAISLKKKCPQLTVYASDISQKALELAKKNALRNEVEVHFLQGDLFEPFQNKNLTCDFLVSNPPYIAENQKKNLQKDVLDFEPHLALFAKDNGMEFYQKMLPIAHQFVNPLGLSIFEIGVDQTDLKNLIDSQFWKTKELKKDYSGQNRFFFLERESNQV